MSKWSIETLSAACAALILIMLGWLAGSAWPALDFWEHVWLTLLLAIPAAIAASCAFMMPVATPPNAIVFGTGHMKIQSMIKAGFALNLFGVVVVTLACYLLAARKIVAVDQAEPVYLRNDVAWKKLPGRG